MPTHHLGDKQVSHFLRLPLELRREIYSYLLPHTYSRFPHITRHGSSPPTPYEVARWADGQDRRDIAWRRGSTRLLMTNRQIHEECADMLYGDNMFVICVGFDSIKFLYQWVVEPKRAPRSRREAALVPKGEKAFLDHFSQRNLLRIKNYIINVELLDSYTGMIKHNCGGNGLAYGIREQVETLVELLVLVPYLQQVHIYLANERYKARPSNTRRRREPVPLDEQQDLLAEAVLSPFTRLFEVRKAKVTGVREDQAELLEQSMMAPRNVGT